MLRDITGGYPDTFEVLPESNMRRVVAACMIGNTLEWYDFAIYGFFAELIGRQFFPESSGSTSILMSLMIFAAGFIARPVGAVFFGIIGDRTSRKDALMYSIYLMAIPTFLIGCWPPYGWVGVAAPIGLTILRILQGIAIGGEFTGSIVFLVEHAQPEKRGLAGSWAAFSLIAGVLLGSGVAATFTCLLTAEQMELWGWRVPFLLSIVGSVVGAYTRRCLVDPAVYLAHKKKIRLPKLATTLRNEAHRIGIVICLDFLTAVGFFTIAIFMPLFFKQYLALEPHSVQLIHTCNMFVFAMTTLCGGYWADRVHPLHCIVWPSLGLILLSMPLFAILIKNHNLYTACMVECTLCILMGLFFGALPSILCMIFPTEVRFTGVSIGHNLSMAFFGGTAPYVATYLIDGTGHNLMAPSWMLIASALLTCVSIRWIRRLDHRW